jgi:predicted signal transduction protein with EAL and GGDEF domain
MEIHITASIGLAMYPADGQRYDALLNRADAAMYVDKARRMSPIYV